MSVSFFPGCVAAQPSGFTPLPARTVEDLVPQTFKQLGIVGQIYQSNIMANASRVSHAQDAVLINLSKVQISSAENGFVTAAIDAYAGHKHLILRPDDVWTAILMQFNLYVNANAEQLRSIFVDFQGQRQLTVHAVGSRYTVDFGNLAQQMTNLIQENVKDPGLRAWVMPEFSTTTDNDRIVASIAMMATLRSYFTYAFYMTCGLPQVTLLGVKEDWEKLVAKAEKLRQYGDQAKQWHTVLKPVLTRFVRTFDNPHSAENKDFWQKIAQERGGGCMPRTVNGWITAFSFFDKKGHPMYRDIAPSALELDGVKYSTVNVRDIAPGYANVNVTLEGDGPTTQAVMIAGSLGMQYAPLQDGNVTNLAPSIQSAAGWMIAERLPERENTRRRLQRFVYGRTGGRISRPNWFYKCS